MRDFTGLGLAGVCLALLLSQVIGGHRFDVIQARLDSLEALAARPAPEPRAILVRAAVEADVPPHLFLAVIDVESAGDSAAVSRRGAVGAGQVMVSEHRNLVVELCGAAERVVELECNARVSARILAGYYAVHDDWPTALAAYNGALKFPTAAAIYVALVDSALGPRHGLF